MTTIREHAKKASSTKRGPGRYHKDGTQKSNATRRRPSGAGQWSLILRNVQTRKNLDVIQARKELR